jgi:hypothetical protein
MNSQAFFALDDAECTAVWSLLIWCLNLIFCDAWLMVKAGLSIRKRLNLNVQQTNLYMSRDHQSHQAQINDHVHHKS